MKILDGLKYQKVFKNRHIPEDMAFDHRDMLLEAQNRLRISLEYSGLATRFLPEYFTLGQIQDIYEIIWGGGVRSCKSFREKLTNVEGWIGSLNLVLKIRAKKRKASNMVQRT